METTAIKTTWLMPDESEPHARTWMAFGASREIWGERLLSDIQDNLATIAKAIAQYEPVSMLVRQEDYEIAARKCGSSVDLVVAPLDDLWMRDTGSVFVKNAQGKLDCWAIGLMAIKHLHRPQPLREDAPHHATA